MLKIFADTSSVSSCAALFPKSIANIQELVTSAKQRALDHIQTVTSTTSRTYENSVVMLDRAQADLSIVSSILSVVKNVHTLKEMRDEASKNMVDLDAFIIDNFSSNRKLYTALKDVQTGFEQDPTVKATYSDAEYRYWLEEEIKSFKRRGMDLPEGSAEFDRVIAIQKELSALGTKFSTNIAEDKSQVLVPISGVQGVPEPIVKNLKKTEDETQYILKMDYPTYFGVMKNCEVAATRKAMADAFENRAFPANESVLRDVIFKRNEMAALLGYASYTHFDLDSKMARTPEAAQKFIEELLPGLRKKWGEELTLLKANLPPSVVLTEQGDIQYYDIAFCMNEAKKNLLNVSETTIQQYFPLDSTVKALFDIYQSFFNITFAKFDNGESELWHKDVSTLSVTDNVTGELLGFVIMDLFPREGKYTHACCHSVVPPVRVSGAENKYSPAFSVVLANFPAPTADSPALFLHDDVKTFFHEFGHALHGLMGRSKMATFAGTRVKRDFVELPSQMLEEWLWEPSILSSVTSHYKTKETLPADLIKAKVASQNAFSGRDSLRQLIFAQYALRIFGAPFATTAPTPDALQPCALFHSIEKDTLQGIRFNQEAHFECAFAHLMGYGAAYYGYMWSEVFAIDVFEYIRTRNGLLSSVLGGRYRSKILGLGGGRDPNEMLVDFLEREPNSKAFLHKLGVTL